MLDSSWCVIRPGGAHRHFLAAYADTHPGCRLESHGLSARQLQPLVGADTAAGRAAVVDLSLIQLGSDCRDPETSRPLGRCDPPTQSTASDPNQ